MGLLQFVCFCIILFVTLPHQQLQAEETFHHFSAYRLDKEGTKTLFSFKNLAGKIVMVVNVASECGYTADHYDSLNAVYRLYGPTGKFEILAFPCNQFGRQEPKSSREVYKHVTSTYNVKFPLFEKTEVAGENAADFFKWLAKNSVSEPDWNFWKYFVSADGKKVLGAWGPSLTPNQLLSHLEQWISEIPENSEESNETNNQNEEL